MPIWNPSLNNRLSEIFLILSVNLEETIRTNHIWKKVFSYMMKGAKVLFVMYYDIKMLELMSRDTGERVNRVIYIVHKVQTSMQKVG
jgi:hypothetical protein